MSQRFFQGSRINILTAYLRGLELSDGPTHPASRHHTDDSDDDTDDDKTPSQSKLCSLQKSKGTALLRRSNTTRSIHKIKVNFQDPSASIKIPDSMCNADILRLQMYTAGICVVLSKLNKFTDGMECAICGEKLSLDNCTTLLVISFLRKLFIIYCLQWKRTQRQMTTITAVNKM